MKTFPELRTLEIRSDEVLVQLELTKPANLIMPGQQEKGEGGFPTGRGWIVKVGTLCKSFSDDDIGKMVWFKNTVDLKPEVDISHTNVPHLVQNPNCNLFTFKDVHDEKERKAYAKNPTALIYEHQVAGIYTGD